MSKQVKEDRGAITPKTTRGKTDLQNNDFQDKGHQTTKDGDVYQKKAKQMSHATL